MLYEWCVHLSVFLDRYMHFFFITFYFYLLCFIIITSIVLLLIFCDSCLLFLCQLLCVLFCVKLPLAVCNAHLLAKNQIKVFPVKYKVNINFSLPTYFSESQLSSSQFQSMQQIFLPLNIKWVKNLLCLAVQVGNPFKWEMSTLKGKIVALNYSDFLGGKTF